MADTTVQPNNRAVRYRGSAMRERPRPSMLGSPQQSAGPADAQASQYIGGRTSDDGSDQPDFQSNTQTGMRMPAVSQAQARAMYAAASGNSTLGIPKKVGKEFTEDMGKGSVKKLPKRVKKRAAGGPVKAGEAYQVGEKGPETYLPGVGDTVRRKTAVRMKRKAGMISDRAASKRLSKYAGNSDDIQGLDASSR